MGVLGALTGLVMAVFGSFMVVRRVPLAAREGERPNIGPTGWTVLGGTLVLSGVIQVLAALV